MMSYVDFFHLQIQFEKSSCLWRVYFFTLAPFLIFRVSSLWSYPNWIWVRVLRQKLGVRVEMSNSCENHYFEGELGFCARASYPYPYPRDGYK